MSRTTTVLALLIGIAAAFLIADRQRAANLLLQPHDQISHPKPVPPVPLRVVCLNSRTMQQSAGSGFAIGPGRVVTCAHVVNGATPLSATWPVEGRSDGARCLSPRSSWSMPGTIWLC